MRTADWDSHLWARIAAVTAASAPAAFLAGRSPTLLRGLAPLDVATARITEQILIWLGMSPQREMSTLIHSGGFGYEIAFACTGLVPAGLLAAAILATCARLRTKLYGMAAGMVGMLILNQIRLVSLFWIGVHWPWLFEVAHGWIWQGMTVAYLVGFFCTWKVRSSGPANLPGATPRIEESSHRA